MASLPRIEQLPDGVTRVSSQTLVCYMRKAGPGVLVMRQFGHDTSVEMTQVMMRELVTVITQDGSVMVYCDLRSVTRFDSSARGTWVDFFKQHGARFRGGCALINSKLIDMAISLIGMAIGSQRARSTTKEADLIRMIQEGDRTFTAEQFAMLCDPAIATRTG